MKISFPGRYTAEEGTSAHKLGSLFFFRPFGDARGILDDIARRVSLPILVTASKECDLIALDLPLATSSRSATSSALTVCGQFLVLTPR